MPRSLLLSLLAPCLGGCVAVASLETAVPRGSEVLEPRLLGTWEISEGSSLTARVTVTREGAAQYLVREVQVRGDSNVYLGRLGPLGAGRWLLELSPVADTTRYTHAFMSRDSTRLSPPSAPLMVPVHTFFVVERADSGLSLAMFNGDSLLAQLESGRFKAPYAVRHEDIGATVLLTDPDTANLSASLREFADRPGALITLPRVGRRITAPSWH